MISSNLQQPGPQPDPLRGPPPADAQSIASTLPGPLPEKAILVQPKVEILGGKHNVEVRPQRSFLSQFLLKNIFLPSTAISKDRLINAKANFKNAYITTTIPKEIPISIILSSISIAKKANPQQIKENLIELANLIIKSIFCEDDVKEKYQALKDAISDAPDLNNFIPPDPKFFRKVLSTYVNVEFKPEEIRLYNELINEKILEHNKNELKLNLIDVTIKAEGNAQLDGVEILNPKQRGLPPDQQKWIIYYPGSAETYEESLEKLHALSEGTEANVLCANYRGVGNSTGGVVHHTDILADGEATLQHLKNKGIPLQNTIVYGFSQGGAVATHLAANNPQLSLCVDRSFATFQDAIRSTLSNFAGKLGRLIAFMAKGIIKKQWEFNSAQNYENAQGQKFTIRHMDDKIVGPEAHIASKVTNAVVFDLRETRPKIKPPIKGFRNLFLDFSAHVRDYTRNESLVDSRREIYGHIGGIFDRAMKMKNEDQAEVQVQTGNQDQNDGNSNEKAENASENNPSTWIKS